MEKYINKSFITYIYLCYICTSLTNVTIPRGLTTINNQTFAGCSSLANLLIPNSVTTIGEQAFQSVPHIEYNGTATGAPWEARSMN